ncbi:MAG TPA: phospholipase D family protein [Nitrosarchaeum sp.]|nr:phospholipase D family protein [Nitrosarchaeum sp.]
METHIGQGVGKYIESELFSAKDYVLISSPAISYVFGEKLINMAKAGIKIKVITSDSHAADSDKTNLLVRNFIRLAKNDVKSEESVMPSLEYKIVSPKEVALIHAKIYVMDGKCAIVGSANLTENSFWNFAEYVLITRNSSEIKEIEKDYDKLWGLYHDSEIEEPGVKKDLKNTMRKIRRKF